MEDTTRRTWRPLGAFWTNIYAFLKEFYKSENHDCYNRFKFGPGPQHNRPFRAPRPFLVIFRRILQVQSIFDHLVIQMLSHTTPH